MRRRKRMLDELDQEIREHIERETQDNIERGIPAEEARYAAVRKFGNVMRVKEETREVWSFIWLEADTPGSYAGTCSEFCGAQHAWMRFRVTAEPDETFQTWLKNEARATVSDVPGSDLGIFGDKGCANCHTIVATAPSSGKGPSLAHLASREFLGGGIARNTPENLMLWVTDPQAAKPGNRMPNTPLTAEERRALLTYLESLR